MIHLATVKYSISNQRKKTNLSRDPQEAHKSLHLLVGKAALSKMVNTIFRVKIKFRIRFGTRKGWLTEEHRHHLSLNPVVKKISPVPRLVSLLGLPKEAKMTRARGCGGARHGADEAATRGAGEPLVRFASGPFRADGDRGRLVPETGSSWACSILISSSSTLDGVSIRRHGLSAASRATNIVPAVPIQRFKMGLKETHDPQRKLSYSSPVISGGGSPEDDTSDAASSLAVSVTGAICEVSSSPKAGLGSLELGRSRRLQQDS